MQQPTSHQKNTAWQWMFHPFLFPMLAIGAWLTYLLFFPADFTLDPAASAQPGQATQLGIDVSLRVGLFYKSFFLLFGFAGVGLYLLKDWLQRESPPWLQLWQALAVGGLGLLWLKIMGSPQLQTEYLLFSLCIALAGYQLVQRIQDLPISVSDFFALAALALGLAFLLKFANGQFLIRDRPFALSWILSFTMIFGLRVVLHRSRKVLLPHYMQLVMPLACIPLLLVFSQEVYFFANHVGFYSLSPNVCMLVVLVLGLVAWMYWVEPRLAKRGWTQTQYLDKVMLPILLVGLVAFGQHQVYLKYPREIFELANGANGIMRWFHFGEWPIIEWLSSHLLYDVDVRAMYSLIYGYDGSLDFLMFDFIPKTIFALVGYLFLKSILKNAMLAFALALFFPFILSFLPSGQVMGLCTLFILQKLLTDFSNRKIIFLGTWLTFLLLWKIEIGLSSIAGTLLVLFWYQLHEFDRKKVLSLAKLALAFVGGGLVLFLLIQVSSDVDLYSHFRQAVDYFGANQAHAYAQISKDAGLHFQYHYFIFPFLMGCIGLFFLFQKQSAHNASKHPYFAMTMIFMIGYYLFNAQRGIVRHGLIEGTETFISSFAYLILGLLVYYVIKNKRYASLALVAALLFMFQNYKHRSSAGQKCQFEWVSQKFGAWKNIKHKKEKIRRVWGGEKFAQEKYQAFKNFMDANFDADATFIDFSTNPMLYFYTQRRVPSYFNQYLQNTVTDFLQDENIKDLEKYDVPVVVFSHYPEADWFDNIDGVPNTVRFAALANYIYQNYQPNGIYDGYYVWTKKELGDSLSATLPKGWIDQHKHHELGYLPTYSNIDQTKAKEIYNWNGARSTIPINLTGRISLQTFIQNQSEQDEIDLRYFAKGKELGKYSFKLQSGEATNEYTIPISSQYNWHQFEVDSIAFRTASPDAKFLSSSLIQIADED